MFVEGDTENGQKKCDERRRSKKQKSQQSLDSASQQLSIVKSSDTFQPLAATACVANANVDADVDADADADADAAATHGVDSDLTVIDSNVAVSEESGQQQDPVIGLLLAVC